MKDEFRQALRGYVIAVATVMMTCLVWVTSTTLIGNRVSSSFFLMAVVIVSRLAGYGPSWLALILGAIPVTYSQYLRLGLSDLAALTIIIVYFILGSIIVWVMQSERNARLSAERNAVEALEKQRLLEKEIAERKEAEDKLRTRESQLSGILDNTSAVVYLKDSDGRYLLANRRYLALFQQDGDTIIGKKDTAIFPDQIAHNFQESDARVWQAQTSLDFEEVAPHADGLHTYRSVKFPVRDEMGKMIALGGISTDITDLKIAHDALKKQRELLRNLIDVQENEKQFLCHEFHDGLIQYAVGSQMLLEGYRDEHPSSDAAAVIDTVIGNLRKGIDDGRRAIRGIRPAVLDDSNIKAAIHDLIDQFSASEMMVTFNCDPKIGLLQEPVQTTIYRVVQEALNNATKHSGTDVVRIELNKSNGDVLLEIRDFGCGFDVKGVRTRGFGLLGMSERVRLLGGECSIRSEMEAGTTITARFPTQITDD